MTDASQIIEQADTDRVNTYYKQIHTAERPSELADAITVALDPILQEARADQRRMRALLREADQRVQALELLLSAAQAVHDGAPADAIALTGRQIADVAVDVARSAGRSEMHYHEWFGLFRAAGHFIAGANPEATFLTAITRHPEIEGSGDRSGVYRLHEPAVA